jgi:hypothetical protein
MERRPRQCSGALRATAVPGHHREALGYLRKHPEPGVGISWARQLQNCSLFDGRCYGTAFLRELYFCSNQARLEVYWTSCILGGFDEWRRSIPSQFARSVARGRVCRAPSKNTFCIDLDRIRAERGELSGDLCLFKPTIKNVLPELGALGIAVNHHVSGDSERFGQGRIHRCAAALCKVNHCYTMSIEWPSERPPSA